MGGSMDPGHGQDGITVKPGKTAELTRTFATAGTIEVGCHEPGHYASGMKIKVVEVTQGPARCPPSR